MGKQSIIIIYVSETRAINIKRQKRLLFLVCFLVAMSTKTEFLQTEFRRSRRKGLVISNQDHIVMVVENMVVEIKKHLCCGCYGNEMKSQN